MLDINFTSSLKKNIILSIFAIFVLSCTFLLMIGSTYHIPDPPETLLGIDNNGENTSSRINFLSSLGYSVSATTEEVQEAKIPMEFNDVYENYNKIQLEIGTDLHNYLGTDCVRYTYTVQGTEFDGEMRANLLVYQNRIIGGDVCSVALNGEMLALSVQNADNAE